MSHRNHPDIARSTKFETEWNALAGRFNTLDKLIAGATRYIYIADNVHGSGERSLTFDRSRVYESARRATGKNELL